jgi:hypothetical protein
MTKMALMDLVPLFYHKNACACEISREIFEWHDFSIELSG